ncbi:MAG: InlB B-repeat-containing protein [Lachnospiraceae bacterium]|nr:InlB B-repeat-containing protein [Lachnospiraceae bacterium]
MKKAKRKKIRYGLLSVMLMLALVLTNLEGLYPAMFVHAATTYKVEGTVYPGGAGQIIGFGSYNAGDTVTMVAMNSSLYMFEAWIDPDLGMEYRENPYVFTADRNRYFNVLYRRIGYFFIFQPQPNGGSVEVVSPSPSYLSQAPGTQVTLKATAQKDYRFDTFLIKDSRDGEYRSLEGNTFTVPDHDVWVSAKFVSTVPRTVNVSGNLENGTVTFEAGKNTFLEGDVVNMTIKANEGYRVSEVAGVPSGASFSGNVLSFVMPGRDLDVTVTFEKKQMETIQFSVLPQGGGTITSNTVAPGRLEVTAVPSEGYSFLGWYDDPDLKTPISTEITTTLDTSNTKKFYVLFMRGGNYSITGGVYPKGSGRINLEKNPSTGAYTLSAIPNYGYQFECWTNANEQKIISLDNPFDLYPTSDMFVGAIFSELESYAVHNDLSTTHGTLSIVDQKEKYIVGDEVELCATPDDGYAVNKYYYGTSADLQSLTPIEGNKFQMPAFEVWVYADFVRSFNVKATESNAAYGSVSGGGTYKEGETVELLAVPKDGCRFVNWTENGKVVSISETYQFQATADRELVANFAPEGYDFVAFYEDFESGSLDGWTQYDLDDDDRCWEIGEGVNGKALHPNTQRIISFIHRADDLIVTPGILVPDNGELSFWCKQEKDFEEMEVYVLRKPSAENGYLQKVVYEFDSTYKKYTLSLKEYAGQTIYVGFRNITRGKAYDIVVDDVMVAAKTPGPLKVTKKSLTLYDTITIAFKVDKSLVDGRYHDPYLMVTQNGAEEKITEYTIDETNGLYVFNYRVAPHTLRDVVTAVPHALDFNNADVAGEEITYSVEEYCHNMLSNELYQLDYYANFRRLLVDILLYGDAAQKYVGYKTNELASYRLTDAQRAMGTDVSVLMNYQSVKEPNFAAVGDDAKLAGIEKAALYLEAAVNVQFKYSASSLSGLRVVITDNEACTNVIAEYPANASLVDKNGLYYVNVNALNAGQMRKTIYATVMKGNQKVSNTYRYSIESYVESMKGKGGEGLDNLLDAMMRYGDSAAAYVNNN